MCIRQMFVEMEKFEFYKINNSKQDFCSDDIFIYVQYIFKIVKCISAVV